MCHREMFGRLKAWWREERGQSLVETALAMGLLVLLLGGLVDLGRALREYTVITNAAREGARYASLFPADADGIVNTVVQAADDLGLSLHPGQVLIDGFGALEGQSIRVGVEYEFVSILGRACGQPSWTMRTSTAMVTFGVE